jgi:pyruvate,water dikinase
MEPLGHMIRRLLSRNSNAKRPDIEGLRTEFKARYYAFKLLLNANNRALEIMADMEEALKGTRPFGMNFVSSRCTSVSASVWQMIKHLNELSLGKYEALSNRFKEIRKEINPFVKDRGRLREGPLVLILDQVERMMADLVGGKIANLAEIKNRIHLKVSDGFVITACGYQRFMAYNDLQPEIDRRIQATDVQALDELFGLSASLQQLIIGSSIPRDLEEAIQEQYGWLEEREGRRITVAMRSSALGEDVAGISFAGQYRSELNVSKENLLQAYKEVVASKYSLPAMSYRLNRGIRDEDVVMCVGCLRMADAVSGGVIYSRNPVNIRDDVLLINSVWGLPKSVVDGNTTPDLIWISGAEPMEIKHKEIAFKERKFVCYPDEGVCRMDLSGEEGAKESLSDEQALELAGVARRLETYYGCPQDIEWALDADGSFVILQCRPLVQAAAGDYPDPKDVWEGKSVLIKGGTLASPGLASGPVFVLKKDMDVMKFPDGAVLVAAQALPRWATLLNKASAVVTEQGSIAGHLANVAREFSIPALFGVQEAMERLQNGRIITVDADGGRVFEGRVEGLLEKTIRPRNLMLGSPVYAALKGAAQHIVPLSLLDPDIPSFTPGNCKTFHDITRFCHEKSVHEMFRFGKDHHFHERSGKQLFVNIPMNWWVLNLDDGFRKEIEGKYVQLENIVSIPMLALWKGITAFPWEGPPPVDGKGLMSVMFEATRNTELVPGMRSRYADRNYFMISKNYCSLSSRFGFHLSIIETLVSERVRENYIRFQFKGGAADDERRNKRVLFLTEILEGCGFRVQVKDDFLMAGLEDQPKEDMEKSLRILGYLIIHTRQLDVIMGNDQKVRYYRSKIYQSIDEILSVR